VIGWLLLLALPCAAADLFLTPSSFELSPGERFTVMMEGATQIKDPVLVAPSGVYNLTNLRSADGVMAADGAAKAKGSLVVAAKSGLLFGKALLTCAEPGETARKAIGHALEIVPAADSQSIQVLLRGKPAAGINVEIKRGDDPRKPAGITGADGVLRLPLTSSGVYRIAVSAESMSATLTFERK